MKNPEPNSGGMKKNLEKNAKFKLCKEKKFRPKNCVGANKEQSVFFGTIGVPYKFRLNTSVSGYFYVFI